MRTITSHVVEALVAFGAASVDSASALGTVWATATAATAHASVLAIFFGVSMPKAKIAPFVLKHAIAAPAHYYVGRKAPI